MIMKVSSSGKQLQIVDEEGNVFVTSVFYAMKMLEEASPGKILLLSRLPLRVSPDRFSKSPLYEPNTGVKSNIPKDAYSESHKKTLEEKKSYNTDEVMF